MSNTGKVPRARRQREKAIEAVDSLVDRFVAAVNVGHREPVNTEVEGVPPSVLIGEPDEHGFCDGAIKPYAPVTWIEPLERRLGYTLPDLFRSLVTRYIFPAFEAGDVFFFAHTPEGTKFKEFRTRVPSGWPAVGR